MWGDWDEIEAAQAKADAADEERRRLRAERKLRVVPDPVVPANEPLRAPETGADRVAATPTPAGAFRAPRQPRDEAERQLLRSQGFGSPDAAQEALDALEAFLGALLPGEEDTDG